MLDMLLLGSATLGLSGEAVTPPTRKALGLVAYLALEGQSQREHLARLLWSGMGAERARRNLRQELYRLSSTPLGPVLTQDAESVGLQGQPVTDVARFRQLIQAGRLAEAVALYRGPLLENLRLSGASGFERWLEQERAALASLRNDALARHAASLTQAGEHRAALVAYQELLNADDLQEHHHREVMWLNAVLGERGAALERYEHLQRVLRREVGLEPLPETVALAERIRAGEVPVSRIAAVTVQRGSPVAPPLIEREQVWAHLERSHARLVVLTGEAGIGKTRLALEFAASEIASDKLIVQGRDDARATPLAPVAEAIRKAIAVRPEVLESLGQVWRLEVARLVPELVPNAMPEPPSPEGRSRFLEGLIRALLLMAEDRAVVFDDLHLFDASSLELLGLLLRRQSPTVRMIATVRQSQTDQPPELNTLLETLERDGLIEQIALEPLTESGLKALATQLANREVNGHAIACLFAATAGNPLHALEAIRGVLESGHDLDSGDHSALPASLREVVLKRVGRLGAEAQRMLEAASVAGNGFELDWLAAASALTDWQVLEALERSQAAQLIEVNTVRGELRGFRFAHDLVRDVLRGTLSGQRERLLHRKLAASLEDQAGPSERTAHHLERGGQAKRAVPHRVRAAQAAKAVFAYDQALEQYALALEDGASDAEAFEIRQARTTLREHLDDRTGWAQELEALNLLAARLGDPALRVQATLNRADFAFAQGQFAEVLRLTEPLLTQAQGLWAVRVRHRLGSALMHLGRAAEARIHLETALADTPCTEPGLRGKLQHALAACAFDTDDLPEARTHVNAALESLRAARDHSGEAASLNLKGHIAFRLGEPGARRELEVALARSKEVGAVPVQLRVLLNLAAATMGEGDFDAAMTHLEDGLVLAREPQNPQLEAAYLMHLAALHWARGDLGAVVDAATMGLAVFDTLESARLSIFNRVRLAGFLLECGDPTGARTLLTQGRALLERHSYPALSAWLESMVTHCEIAEGQAQPALKRIEHALEAGAGISEQYRQQLLWALAAAQQATHNPRAVLETVAKLDGSPEHRARGLVLRLEAQTMLRLRPTHLETATAFLGSNSVPPATKLHLHRALMLAFASSGATADSARHRREASVLIERLADTLESGMQAGFRERWSDMMDLAPSLEPIN